MDRGVCETCVAHALAAIHARTAPSSTPRAPQSPSARAFAGIAFGSALLGIVSATSAALASVHFIRDVQLRTLAPAPHPHRNARRPVLVAPSPQPALAQPPVHEDFVSDGPPSILAEAGPTTHDPAYLVARARRLADAGADVTVVSLRIPSNTLDHAVQSMLSGMSHTRVVPLYRSGHAAGLRIESADGPLFALAGIRDGDVLTALNGYALPTTDESNSHFGHVMDEHLFVAELVRDSHRVVLAVSWPDDNALRVRDEHDAAVAVHEVNGASRLHPSVQTVSPLRRERTRRSTRHGAGTRGEGTGGT